MQVKLVSDIKLTRNQKRHTRAYTRVSIVLGRVEAVEKSAKQLLNACAYVYGPKE